MASITLDRPFVRKHLDKISGVLSCFDALVLLGHSTLSCPAGLEGFHFREKVLLKDFATYPTLIVERVRDQVNALVARAGPLRYTADPGRDCSAEMR